MELVAVRNRMVSAALAKAIIIFIFVFVGIAFASFNIMANEQPREVAA